MAQSYYVIELTLKWLILLLAGLALLMVLAFVGGYGAAWSVFRAEGGLVEATPTPRVLSVELPEETEPKVVLSEATPVPPRPTLVPRAGGSSVGKQKLSESPVPTHTVPAKTPTRAPTPRPTATPKARATKSPKKAAATVFWVQVLASRHIEAIEKARRMLVEIGFPNDHHRVIESRVAGGGTLLKLRVGPFPDHESAERVRSRLQKKKFPDAWVVKP